MPEEPFPRITYDEAVEMLEDSGMDIEWGDDLSIPEQRNLGRIVEGAYFITDWLSESKPFYAMPREDRSEVSRSFDLLHGEIELASGSMRVDDRELLEWQLKERGLDPENFEHHLKNFDWGLPPHSGFGLGLERLTMSLAEAGNIRECSIFPRDMKRLTP